MKKMTKTLLIAYAAAAAAGVLLHFLYQWFPNPVLALISPARESVWEHVKLLYFPLLCVSLVMGRGGTGAGAGAPAPVRSTVTLKTFPFTDTL